MTKHTPGPWAVTTGCYEHAASIANNRGEVRPAVSITYHVIAEGQDGYQARHNATLIEAAPYLYDALRRLVGACPCDGPEWNAARAAIAKVEGRG